MPSMPTLPLNWSLRAPTKADAEAIVSLLTLCENTVEYRGYRVSDLLERWRKPGFHLKTDAWVLVTGEGVLVGYAFVQPDEKYLSTVCEHPAYRGKGVWPFLLQRVEERASQHHLALSVQAPLLHSTALNSENTEACELVDRKGYHLMHRSLLMEIETQTAPAKADWPEGISVRSFVVGQDERVAHEFTQAAFELSEPDPFEEWESLFTDDLFDPGLWFFAHRRNEIVGEILCYSYPDFGWVWELGVLSAWRHRGIGKALLQTALGELYRRGKRTVGLDVNAENTAAVRLYQQAGMRITRHYLFYEKQLYTHIG